MYNLIPTLLPYNLLFIIAYVQLHGIQIMPFLHANHWCRYFCMLEAITIFKGITWSNDMLFHQLYRKNRGSTSILIRTSFCQNDIWTVIIKNIKIGIITAEVSSSIFDPFAPYNFHALQQHKSRIKWWWKINYSWNFLEYMVAREKGAYNPRYAVAFSQR